MAPSLAEKALAYHSMPVPGKLEVLPTKPCFSQQSLSLAYTPGVACACKDIVDHPDHASAYTGRNNLLAMITNGSAILGLGDIGPLAGKPVMEGKSMLYKFFADINVYDLELDIRDPDKFIETVTALSPTFGGIHLEDIKAPECFYIEETLRSRMNIPIYHDDQHGSAIVTGAALINALHLTGRTPAETVVVVAGAGAAGIACARLFLSLGIQKRNIRMFDSKGCLHEGREDLNPYKAAFAQPGDMSPAEALTGADVFLGMAAGNIVTGEMIRNMAPSPVIFACANPEPEISAEEAKAARPDAVMGTGRSDLPNQINNVSAFPFLMRGVLDIQASSITPSMELAAAHAIAMLAREPVPEEVAAAYGGRHFSFGREYLLPKPFDPRLMERIAPAVAQAAMESGVAAHVLHDPERYRAALKARIHNVQQRVHAMMNLE
ncbi:malic enzyme-like NAD(P)-binding protein [uncultured Mailhella sp.]|uniref:malic enzyme-like NAD(P)-binding protein n=1 Tax=uncultured Mailhella sp. TaxID=1981031 RepID=UPI0025DDFA09|nr:malic enzyme-like NAD(P)-binding protein [uncultured Mailhella sp.]